MPLIGSLSSRSLAGFGIGPPPVVPSISYYYGATATSGTISSSRLTLSSAQAKFGTGSLKGTTTSGFAGRGNAVNVPLSASLVPPLTIEGWVYLTTGYTSPNYDLSPSIYLQGPTEVDMASTNPTNSISLTGAGVSGGASPSFLVQIYQPSNGLSYSANDSSNPIPLSTWTHMALAIAADGVSTAVWINGTRRSLMTLPRALTGAMSTLTLNASSAGSGPQYIDDIRVSKIDRYGVTNTTITVPTSRFFADANTLAVVNFDTPTLYDKALSAVPVSSGVTVVATPSKYSPGSIKMPYTGTPYLQVSGLANGNTFTLEAWRYITATPGGFDFIFEITVDANNYIFVQNNGTCRGKLNGNSFATSSSSWTDTLNTWDHYVMVFNASTGQLGVARNGTRVVGINVLSGIGTLTGAVTKVSFKDSLYGGQAAGFYDEVRVSNADVYSLITSTTYTTPTGPLTVGTNTKHLFTMQ